jgi:hypothetical protein
VDSSVTGDTFSNQANATLCVPKGSKAGYEAAAVWNRFKEIIEFEPEGIDMTDISAMDNAIYVEPAEGLAGRTVDIGVKLKKTLTPVGCSFMLTLPEGLQLTTDEDGETMVTFSTQILDDMAAGDYVLRLTKCLMQSKKGDTTTDTGLSDVVTRLTVSDYTMGDVNGDGSITPADVIEILYMYFGTGSNAARKLLKTVEPQ